MVLDGMGGVSETVGGYDDLQSQSQPDGPGTSGSARLRQEPSAAPEKGELSAAARKPTYKEQRLRDAQKRELGEMPQLIERLEAEQHQLQDRLADPAFYQQENLEITRCANRLKQLDEELRLAYLRWDELDRQVS
jgi:ATP-binding cassette subfamily F protein uup